MGPTAAETIDLRAPEQVRTEADLIRVVEIGRGDSAYTETFLALLDERHAVYQGVGTPVVTRMRGALLLALGHRALPTAALPFVIEELETAHEAWLTAVAAHVLRKYPEPLPSFAQPLLSAILYIRHRDDVVRLANYAGHGPGGETTTAMAEVMRTIAWLGRCGMACLSSLEDLLAQNPGPATSAMAADAIKAIREDDQTPASGMLRLRGGATCDPPRCPEGHLEPALARPLGGRVELRGSVSWPAVHRRVLLHALRQPREMPADHV